VEGCAPLHAVAQFSAWQRPSIRLGLGNMSARTPEQDQAEKRAQNCLAKAAYCKWVASITADQEFKQYCIRLSAQWQKEAEAGKPDPQ
jgi:hypothetical protein